jgi:hypothetical protein
MAEKSNAADDAEMLKHLDLLLTIDPANVDFDDVMQDLDVLTGDEAPEEEQ